MTQLRFKNRNLALQAHESVLDCLLRNGEAIPYACKAGMCQACLIRAVDCEATAESRKWIKPALQARGYTLACQWVPENDAAAVLPSVEEFSVAVRISELQPLNPQVQRVRLQPEDPARMFAYRPGQYLTLINPEGCVRSYSIANDFELDHFVELHISTTTHGEFTRWLFTKAHTGMLLHMRGPAGDCYYSNLEGNAHPLLLAGTGTGLAPLYGIARDALRQQHTGSIHLYHGGRTAAQLYYVNELQQLEREHPQFHYHPCAAEAEKISGNTPGLLQGRLEPLIAAGHDTALLPQTRIHLCGAPDFVHGMRKRLFLKGARSGNIHCDPFTERSVA